MVGGEWEGGVDALGFGHADAQGLVRDIAVLLDHLLLEVVRNVRRFSELCGEVARQARHTLDHLLGARACTVLVRPPLRQDVD